MGAAIWLLNRSSEDQKVANLMPVGSKDVRDLENYRSARLKSKQEK